MKQKKSAVRITRMDENFHWDLAPDIPYKPTGDNFANVRRVNLAGTYGESTCFHLRYFELAPGGYTTFERHEHEHVIFVVRGEGRVRIGQDWYFVEFGDVAYVPPHFVHQLRNPGSEPFGFLCVVNADRDKPEPVEEGKKDCSCD
ncbi:MAG: cupin domain-containing protein [Alphaproteobacteria bacterium]